MFRIIIPLTQYVNRFMEFFINTSENLKREEECSMIRTFLFPFISVIYTPKQSSAADHFRNQPQRSTIACAKIFALTRSSSTTANSSGPCILLSVSGIAAPNATPFSR